MSLAVPMFLAGVAGIFAIVSRSLWRVEARRRKRCATFALSIGFSYSPVDNFGLTRLGLDFFKRNQGQARDLMGGRHANRDVLFFTQSCRAGKTTIEYSCVLVALPATPPQLAISRQSNIDRLKDLAGIGDLEFESEEFNRAFRVTGSDRRFASAVVDQSMMTWLLEQHDGRAYEISGECVLVWSAYVEHEGLVALLQQAESFIDRIPAVAWSVYSPGNDPSSSHQFWEHTRP